MLSLSLSAQPMRFLSVTRGRRHGDPPPINNPLLIVITNCARNYRDSNYYYRVTRINLIPGVEITNTNTNTTTAAAADDDDDVPVKNGGNVPLDKSGVISWGALQGPPCDGNN